MLVTYKVHRKDWDQDEEVKIVCDTKMDFPPLGSYDHTVKLFDARVDKSVLTMDHGQPVESLLLYPSEGLLVSAGKNFAKLFLDRS